MRVDRGEVATLQLVGVCTDPLARSRKQNHMKPKSDDVLKAFKGLAIAAKRARELASDQQAKKLFDDLPRPQRDIVRQQLLDIESDVKVVLQRMTGKK